MSIDEQKARHRHLAEHASKMEAYWGMVYRHEFMKSLEPEAELQMPEMPQMAQFEFKPEEVES